MSKADRSYKDLNQIQKRMRSVLWKKYFKYNIVWFVIEYKLKMLYSNYYKL